METKYKTRFKKEDREWPIGSYSRKDSGNQLPAYNRAHRLGRFLREGPNNPNSDGRKIKIWNRYNQMLLSKGKRADLTGLWMSSEYLRGVNLRGADLRGVHLRQTSFFATDLREADLRSVSCLDETVCISSAELGNTIISPRDEKFMASVSYGSKRNLYIVKPDDPELK